MNRLTTKAHWEETYSKASILKFTKEPYLHHILKEKYIKKYFPHNINIKLLEIGSAPGHFLVNLHKSFHYDVYGVDYSKKGIEINKKLFEANQIDPNKAIYADFFSNDFHRKNKETFDIVISRNFIEHFADIEKVVRFHLNLLKKNGIILLIIPNLKGINLLLAKLFNKSQLSQHNLRVMQRNYIPKLFKKLGVSELVNDYFGMVNFCLFGIRDTTSHKRILKMLYGLQSIINTTVPFFWNNNSIESSILSPYLIYVGIKGGDYDKSSSS